MKTMYLRSLVLTSLLMMPALSDVGVNVHQSLIDTVKKDQQLRPSVESKLVDGKRVIAEDTSIRVMVRIKEGINPSQAYKEFMKKNRLQSNDIEMLKSFPITGTKVGIKAVDKKHILVLKSKTMSKEELLRVAKKIQGAEFAEVSSRIHVKSIPNDPLFPELWGMNNDGINGGLEDADIDAPEAWEQQTGSSDVVVGIIDTGVDYTHEDLVNNIWTNPGEIPNNGIDDDGNGYIDDIHGIDTVNNDSDPMDDNHHGTHCAGTIGAEGNNSKGVVGVNWHTSIAACKFLDAGGSGYTSDAIECVEYFNDLKLNHGINVLVTNNSWGGGGYEQTLYDAIDAAGSDGILFAAAAGNEGDNADTTPHYPAAYDLNNIISVAATDSSDQLAYFSNYGATSVDLAAPGVNILSTVPGQVEDACQPNDNEVFFHDGFETGDGNWDMFTMDTSVPFIGTPQDLPNEHWMIDVNEAYTGDQSLNESLNGNYNNNRLQQAVTKTGIDLSNVSADQVVCASLAVKGEIEENWDYLYVYVSADNGATWNKMGTIHGSYDNWSMVSVQLPSEYFVNNLKVALVRSNDSIVNMDGYNVDDVKISTGDMGASGNYDTLSGTSMATPHVTGAVALLAAADPSKNIAQLKQTILDSVDVLASLNGLVLTNGRLNLNNMLNGGTPPAPSHASYIRGASAPWGSTKPEEAMNQAFGTENWADLRMADGCAPFTPMAEQDFIYLEGSDTTANELNTYLGTCRTEIESFVDGGGKLLINSAPNEGGNIDLGFGGVTLNYVYPDTETNNVIASDASHPIFNGPFTPVGTHYYGNYFAHSTITGASVEPIIIGDTGEPTEGDIILGEMPYGSGHVLFGGMTTSEWHSIIANQAKLKTLGINSTSSKGTLPKIKDIESDNLMANILTYAANVAVEGEINFDDLPEAETPIPTNYKDLIWSSDFYAGNVASEFPGSGYEHGTVSTPNIALNWYENDVSLSNNTPFDFTSAYITAAWNNDLNVTLTAFKDGTQKYQRSVIVGPYAATKFDFNFDDVDEVRFHSEGGTNAGLEVSEELAAQSTGKMMNVIHNDNKILGSGTHFVLDNVVINGGGTPTPTPVAAIKNDMNGDGFADIVVESTVDYELGAFWGSANPPLLGDSFMTLNSDDIIQNFADMNGDGSMDIISENTTTHDLYVLISNNNNVTPKYLTTLNNDDVVAGVADINGDGYDDIIIVALNGDVTALLGSPTADITSKALINISGSEFVKVADINGDGFDDIIIENLSNYRLNLLEGSATGDVTWKFLTTLASDISIIDTADINGDGFDDIVFQNTTNTRLTMLAGSVTGDVTWQNLTTLGPVIVVLDMADINGDGFDDIIIRNPNNGNISMLWGHAGGVTWNWLLPLPMYHSLVDTSDINGDGYEDMILRNTNNGAVNAYLGTATHNVTWQHLMSLDPDFEVIVR